MFGVPRVNNWGSPRSAPITTSVSEATKATTPSGISGKIYEKPGRGLYFRYQKGRATYENPVVDKEGKKFVLQMKGLFDNSEVPLQVAPKSYKEVSVRTYDNPYWFDAEAMAQEPFEDDPRGEIN